MTTTEQHPSSGPRADTARGRVGARELLDIVLDPGSWQSWDIPPAANAGAAPEYAAELAAAAAKAGTDEALITGTGRIDGRTVAIVVSEFRFLAGSIGRAATERLVAAVERATREGLPLCAAPTSGGTRMQEGTRAFVGMVAISAAVARHKAAGLPFIVYLRNPTTGGVLASWGSLGHFTAAEPGALVGFLGPRVYEALYGTAFPAGVQTAENLYRRGSIDAVLPVTALAAVASRVLNVLMSPREGLPELSELPKDVLADIPAWESVTRSRRPDRPGVRELLRHAATDVVPLSGTGEGEQDPSIRIALARFGGIPCVVLGQDRRNQSESQQLGPAGLRAARRGMRLAHELNLPLISIIDTPGASLSQEAEEGALAGEIARCLADLVALPAPTLCLLLGQGTGGGAIALLPADRVICAEHAWLSPLPPEGASVILHRDVDRAPELAARQRIRSRDLLADGIVDRIVSERPDAADDPEQFFERLSHVLRYELARLLRADAEQRMAERSARFTRLGSLG
ncbi:acetyl-CoA carboxyl transferase [Nakamurella flava]|uniref:Acetyl-CoA carboxyl transferase n=1 Tax=Nakamurella flava TaxID=2576308 RepID=A0A4U6QCU4_9ACTN|nr:carboxyl transferase domain-containing protein [Nakamurella flava]TKV57739.1 acetyl-CoA carboxyl transferase [Nakamurella flava]